MNTFSALRRIESVWSAAIAAIDSKEYPNIVASLNARFPECLNRIADLVTADDVSPSTRLRAAELLNRVLNHLMHSDTKKSEASAVAEKAKAKRETAKARNQRLLNEAAEVTRKEEKRRRTQAARLATALAAAEKIGENNVS